MFNMCRILVYIDKTEYSCDFQYVANNIHKSENIDRKFLHYFTVLYTIWLFPLLSQAMSIETSTDCITLDIGGTIFKTSKQTLCRLPNFFQVICSDQFTNEYQDDGSLFVDRDGSNFQYVLEYLRTGALPDFANLDVFLSGKILREFRYYCLDMFETAKLTVQVFECDEPSNNSIHMKRPSRQEADHIPVPTVDVYPTDLCTVDGHVFYFGTVECRQFIPEENIWISLPDAPIEIPEYSNLLCAGKGVFYVFDTETSHSLVYDLINQQWTQLAPNRLTELDGDFYAVEADDNIYIFSQSNGDVPIEVYSIKSDTWSTITVEGPFADLFPISDCLISSNGMLQFCAASSIGPDPIVLVTFDPNKQSIHIGAMNPDGIEPDVSYKLVRGSDLQFSLEPFTIDCLVFTR